MSRACEHPAPWIHAQNGADGIGWCPRCGRRDLIIPLAPPADDLLDGVTREDWVRRMAGTA